MNIPKIKLIVIAILACTCVWLVSRPRPTEAQRPNRTLFVRGFVVAAVTGGVEKLKDIALPNAKVFLVPFNDLNTPVASALTDLSGRFAIKTNKTGTFTLCIEAEGFPRFCSGNEFRLFSTSNYMGTLRLPPLQHERSATAYGAVTLADGSTPRGFEPFLGVNAFGRVTLTVGGSRKYEAYINNFGEYIIPSIPIDSDFSLRASIENETLERRIRRQTKLQAGRAYLIHFQLRNSKPKIRVMSASSGGKRLQIAAPGSAVVLKTVAEDRERDKLEYRWILPNGNVIGPTTDSELPFTVPTRSGRFPVTVLVSDNRGGYTKSSFSLLAKSGGVPFSGTVVDPNGVGVAGALIEINGRLTNANSAGKFSFEVPLDDKYVLTIRSTPGSAPNQPAYGTISFVYTGSIVGGRWVLRPAQVFSVNPTQPIKLQHKRTQRDCQGSVTSKIDWSNYLGQGLFEWQDGRGNVRSLREIGRRDPKALENVMRLVSRTSPALPPRLAQLANHRRRTGDYKGTDVPCSRGIEIEIPANALENPTTKLAPTGNVEIALSTVDLTAGDQMPGDYSALDPNGNARSMESFGAGSVEIRSGNTRFNLKAGMEATMRIPVDATQLAGNATPPPKIPFLYYDEQKGVWRQEGEATLTGSGSSAVYVKKIKHFSVMNADILKSGQSCVAVEVDPLANFTLPFNVEVTLPPSVVNPNVIQVRTLAVDSAKSNVIYNLPNNTNIVLTPIISGVKPDGSVGNVPAGVFVVNTGGPQVSSGNLPTPNADGTYYAETNGTPTGPCGSRVTLTTLSVPPLGGGLEFLQGFFLQASNITELTASSPAVAANVVQGAVDYYTQADPRSLRASFNLFKTKNKFGQPLGANEVEWDAQYSNSGDLGFGRDMHCRRNVAGDGAFDIACFVTNFGQPPIFEVDQLDADHALAGLNPDATVAMEFSRVENAPGDPNEFPDNNRAVKFFVYVTNDPNGPTVKKADLDGFGERPVPQLCVICHGGQVASEPADPLDPGGPKKGAFTSRNDIMSMQSNFLPFDLHLYNFPAGKSKAAQQTNFKNLNRDIVREVALGNGAQGTAIVEMIDTINPAAQASQLENAVVTNWDGANTASDSHRFYRDVFARACRTCHVALPFSAPSFTHKVDFQNQIGTVQFRVCAQKIMPHAKRTNDIFWTSLNPNMPGFLQLYGQTFAGWSSLGSSQCGLFFQPGTTPESVFTTEIYPILVNNCSGCHSAVGNANFSVGGSPADVYNSIMTAATSNGGNYIVPNNAGVSLLFQRLNANPGPRMPLNGPNLVTTDTDSPLDGIFDATEILNWINSGAIGP